MQSGNPFVICLLDRRSILGARPLVWSITSFLLGFTYCRRTARTYQRGQGAKAPGLAFYSPPGQRLPRSETFNAGLGEDEVVYLSNRYFAVRDNSCSLYTLEARD